MQKKTEKATIAVETIAVAVAVSGNEPIPLTLKVGATVGEALAAAGVSQGSSQLFVSGETADLDDVLEGGDVLSLVSSKQAGTK